MKIMAHFHQPKPTIWMLQAGTIFVFHKFYYMKTDERAPGGEECSLVAINLYSGEKRRFNSEELEIVEAQIVLIDGARQYLVTQTGLDF